MLMNEVFGEENFLAAIIWHRIFSSKNTARHFSEDHDYIIAFARDAAVWLPNLLPRSEGADARYSNPDNDPRGPWASGDLTARNYYGEGQYEVTSPSGAVFRPTVGTYWRVSVGKFAELDRDGRVWWGAQGGNMPRLKRFLSEVKQGMVPRTIWHYDEVGHTQEAKQELLAHVLFGDTENVLDTVKPTRLLRRILQLATTPRMGDVVVDFFSGSSGCAQAVLEQNREDGGNRRFIMVQLPEPLPKPEAALRTIADIGKERIRRVIARMKQGDAGKLDLQEREQPEDLGFRVYKLQASNLQGWAPVSADDEAAVREQLQQQLEPLKEGWTEEAVIAEIALKEGFGLTYGTERVEGVTQNVVYRVTDPDRSEGVYVCLDERLSDGTWRGLKLSGEDLFVCRDRAITDTQAANLALQCRLHVI